MQAVAHRPAGLAGFTLVELMVVIALLGVVSAVIVPELRGTYGEAVLRAASRDLVNVCALASSRAVSLHRPHRVRIDPASGRFCLERRARRVEGGTGFIPVQDVAGCAGVLDPRLQARVRPGKPLLETGSGGNREDAVDEDGAGAAPAAALAFYPDGTADAGEILLRDRAGEGVRLQVNPVTGRVRVVEWRRP